MALRGVHPLFASSSSWSKFTTLSLMKRFADSCDSLHENNCGLRNGPFKSPTELLRNSDICIPFKSTADIRAPFSAAFGSCAPQVCYAVVEVGNLACTSFTSDLDTSTSTLDKLSQIRASHNPNSSLACLRPSHPTTSAFAKKDIAFCNQLPFPIHFAL